MWSLYSLSCCLIAIWFMSFAVYVLINCFIFLTIRFMFVFSVCMFCFLFRVFFVFVLFRVLFLPMYIIVYFLFVYNITDNCHRVATQLQRERECVSYHITQYTLVYSCTYLDMYIHTRAGNFARAHTHTCRWTDFRKITVSNIFRDGIANSMRVWRQIANTLKVTILTKG
jgi:hypothetical protein